MSPLNALMESVAPPAPTTPRRLLRMAWPPTGWPAGTVTGKSERTLPENVLASSSNPERAGERELNLPGLRLELVAPGLRQRARCS